MIAKVCNASANKNMTGIEKIHEAGQHISDHLSAITDDVERGLIPSPASHIDVLCAKDPALGGLNLTQDRAAPLAGSLHRFRGDGGARGDRFQAALVPAGAQRPFLIHADMTTIPGPLFP